MRGRATGAAAASILPFSYGGSNGLLTQDTTDAALWRRFGTSRLARTVCAAPTGAANRRSTARCPRWRYEDYRARPPDRPVGRQSVASRASTWCRTCASAQRRGATARRDRPARARRWPAWPTSICRCSPAPTSPLALAVHRYLFDNGHADEAFLEDHTRGSRAAARARRALDDARGRRHGGRRPAAVETFAALYATSSPALIRCGWGLERNRNGGNAALAVLALPAVGRQVRRPGRRLRHEQFRRLGHRAPVDRRRASPRRAS